MVAPITALKATWCHRYVNELGLKRSSLCRTSRAYGSNTVRAHSLSRAKGKEDSRAMQSCNAGPVLWWFVLASLHEGQENQAGLQDLSIFGSGSPVGLFYSKAVCP